jgi:membrane-associated phospholipid phosphatase
MLAECWRTRLHVSILLACLCPLCILSEARAQTVSSTTGASTALSHWGPDAQWTDVEWTRLKSPVVLPRRTDGPIDAQRTRPARSPEAGGWLPSLQSIGGNVLDIAGAPFQLSTRQQLEVLSASALVAGLIAEADGPANTYIRRGESNLAARSTGPLAAPGRFYDRLGPDRVAAGTAGLLAVGGVLANNRRWTRTSVRVVEAVLYTKGIVGLSKGFVNRTRPFATDSPLEATPGAFSSKHEKLSMPSGHTARAFAVASVVAHEFDQWYVKVPAYAAAASVGLERVRSSDHWLSDVVVGGTLGYLIGRSVSSSLPQPEPIRYRTILSPDRLGIVVRF